MPHYKPPSSECFVFTFKDGLLSPIAHDLKIRVTEFTIDIDDGLSSISAKANAHSLRVECARKGDTDAPAALSTRDKRQIEDNIIKDILASKKYPDILFKSNSITKVGDEFRIEGQLTLHGTTKPITTTTTTQGSFRHAEFSIHQPDFGIRPYTAALGTLRVQPTVRLRITVPV